MAQRVEYVNSEQSLPTARLRRENGADELCNAAFYGVGDGSRGCGGSMRPEYNADWYRHYSTYCRDYDGNHLLEIASGAGDYDYEWTEVLMKNVGHRMA